ncbi:DPAGT1 [Blepharisma stoltei]|uniref:UDP-N-acetylglucosamine--dolichyl-phosphate N-acetylglucosaminephosphotransferase n=1 Tax=Blepharisma stoltei TaxID=1481888 RepID=A0AAU9I3F3_9CILI|nr:unnamed protein product [Blepharisma stoltei]
MDNFNVAISTSIAMPFAIGYYIGFQEWNRIFPVIIASALSFIIGYKLIPVIKESTLAAGLGGRDLNKVSNKKIPESLGIVPATLYLVTMILAQVLFARDHDAQFQYNSATLSVCFMILLGFCDDVLNLRWRYKLLLPTIASLPLLVAYSGTTAIVVPRMLRDLLGYSIELGCLYSLYMILLAVFCTNAINIYAGINGLEAGQSLVIGCAALTHNFIEITLHINDQIYTQHLLSASLLIPFIFNTLALLKYNKYPSKVFVGDTFCYFAGMTLAMAGILGHYSKTLLLFFIPQILNFIFSIPQLIGIVPCPRHRLPKYDPRTDTLECVPTHFTLINFVLWVTGPQHEKNLSTALICFQIMCCALGFYIRYEISQIFYY